MAPATASSTALAQQLSSISLAYARANGGARSGTKRPSLLYDAAAAADIDLATVYEVGLSGEFGIEAMNVVSFCLRLSSTSNERTDKQNEWTHAAAAENEKKRKQNNLATCRAEPSMIVLAPPFASKDLYEFYELINVQKTDEETFM